MAQQKHKSEPMLHTVSGSVQHFVFLAGSSAGEPLL